MLKEAVTKYRPAAVAVTILVFASQILLGIKLFVNSGNGDPTEPKRHVPSGAFVQDVFADVGATALDAEDAAVAAANRLEETPGSVAHLIKHMEPPELDEAEFAGEVERPLREIVERFHGHPELAFKKLIKSVQKEEER